jgi:hypothetical protein
LAVVHAEKAEPMPTASKPDYQLILILGLVKNIADEGRPGEATEESQPVKFTTSPGYKIQNSFMKNKRYQRASL